MWKKDVDLGQGVPSDLSTIAVKTLSHSYLGMFEHVRCGNYGAHTYLFVCRCVTEKNFLVPGTSL